MKSSRKDVTPRTPNLYTTTFFLSWVLGKGKNANIRNSEEVCISSENGRNKAWKIRRLLVVVGSSLCVHFKIARKLKQESKKDQRNTRNQVEENASLRILLLFYSLPLLHYIIAHINFIHHVKLYACIQWMNTSVTSTTIPPWPAPHHNQRIDMKKGKLVLLVVGNAEEAQEAFIFVCYSPFWGKRMTSNSPPAPPPYTQLKMRTVEIKKLFYTTSDEYYFKFI